MQSSARTRCPFIWTSQSSWCATRLLRASPPSPYHRNSHVSLQNFSEQRNIDFGTAAANSAATSAVFTISPTTRLKKEGPGPALGLYGIPGLCTPEEFIKLATGIVAHCQNVQLCLDMLTGSPGSSETLQRSRRSDYVTVELPASEVEEGAAEGAQAARAAESAATLIRQHHEAVSWLRPLAEHCAIHHVDVNWREAAGRTVEALQAVEELLARRLAGQTNWCQLLAEDATAAAQRDSGSEAVLTPAGSPAEGENAEGGIPGDIGARNNAANTATARVHVVGSGVGSEPEQLGGMRREAPAVGAGLRLVSEAISRAAALSQEDQEEHRELELLEHRLVAAFRDALADERVAPVPLVVLHDSEVRGDPLLARHVTQATEAEVAAALAEQKVILALVLPSVVHPQNGGRGGGEPEIAVAKGKEMEVGAGAAAAEVELGPVAAATHCARTRGGRLWTLRLTGPLTSMLVTEHPSIHVRCAVHAVTHGSQAAAALRLMDILRPLRDHLAACLHQPSFAHLKMAGSVAADPRVALALLYDILTAIRPLADEEVMRMQELLMRLRVEDGRGEGGGGAAGDWQDPLDLRGSVDFLSAAQRDPPLSAEEWRELAPYFPVDGLLQGLSRHLSYVLGAELRTSKPHPGELWNPGCIIRLELREKHDSNSSSSSTSSRSASRGGDDGDKCGQVPGELLGVLYIYLDPNCDLPYTVLVRHGYEGYHEGSQAPWLQHQHEAASSDSPEQQQRQQSVEGRIPAGPSSGACPPHVALHIPAGQVTQGSSGYLVPEHPGLIRTLAHELGHALQYMLSYSLGALPDSNACYSSTDFLELASHILERWVADPWVLSSLSYHAVSGTRLSPRRCAAVAATPSRQTTWLELQQHTLAAAADLLMHLNGAVDLDRLRLVPQLQTPSPSPLATAPDQSCSPSASLTAMAVTVAAVPASTEAQAQPEPLLELHSTPTMDLVSALWAAHSSLPGGAFQPTRGLMALLPGFLHNGGVMYAYPIAQLVAAAVWECHFSRAAAVTAAGGSSSPLESPAAVKCGRLLRQKLLQEGDPGRAAAALEALLGVGCVRRVRLDQEAEEEDSEAALVNDGVGGFVVTEAEGGGGAYGVMLDLAHSAFQGVNPLVF